MAKDFDWNDEDIKADTVVHRQDAIAVYLNPNDNVVIRQQGEFDDDAVVVLHRTHVPALIARLQEIISLQEEDT